MSRFDEVKRLKELEEKAKANLPGSRIFFREHMAHAAPWLLQIAEAFQPGDSIMLRELAHDEEQMAKFVSGFGKPDMRKTAMLRRLQAVAEEMER